jgi:hypothetical protein
MKSSAQTQTAAEEQDERLYMPSLGAYKNCGLVLGILVGAFIYLSTLGAEFVAVMVWGRDILDKNASDMLIFSLLWNLLTTSIALLVLAALRIVVSSVFIAAVGETRSAENVKDIAGELLSYIEGRFAVGALGGICVCWNVTNLALGMRPQVIQSCVILVVACLWCRFTLVLLGKPPRALVYDHEEQEEEEPQCEDDKLEPLLSLA